ncbi:hypothetical protein TRAPUB_3857 [Trametes pubescens]|uniref:VWFA domain-containing protein n=1 Tax=Trametes pubescens TaxID=154538 RepID=A0A1M2VD03_TRAPU|nr:hypothetical protein TRAPUB_3857 [Trametes pubescens]
MGNSSSKAPSSAYSSESISYPAPLGDKKPEGACLNRRATSAVPNVHRSSQSLSVPSGSHTHRRSRSALVGSTNNQRPLSYISQTTEASETPPPPSYSEALSDHSFLGVPTQGLGQRSRSQDVPRSNNPFLRRPVSSAGLPSASSEASSATIVSSSPGRSGARQPMTFEERAEYLRRPMRQNTIEDALETLKKYNTVIIVDDSGSMSKGGLWTEAREALAALADVASKYDTDGIDVCFLNSKKTGTNMTSGTQIRRMFDSVVPRGATPIGERLEDLMLYYLNELDAAKESGGVAAFKKLKPVNYIVITDGVPTDDPAAVIAAAAKRLDDGHYPLTQASRYRENVGIQFVQIGSHRAATEYLRTLDDELQAEYHCRDIVDTTPYLGGRLNADSIIKILLGGINRRVDKKGGQSVM